MDAFSLFMLWLHILGAAMWVGSLLFLAFVFLPVLRATVPMRQRLELLDALSRRTNIFGFIALSLLASTGVYNMFHHLTSLTQLYTTTYGSLLTLKIAFFAAIFILSSLHAFVYGPTQTRLGRLLSEDPSVTAQLQKVRRRSIAVSTVSLTLSLAAILVAVALRGA